MNLEDALKKVESKDGRTGGRVIDALCASDPIELGEDDAIAQLRELRDDQPDQLLQLADGSSARRYAYSTTGTSLELRNASPVARRFIDSLITVAWVMPRSPLEHSRDRRLQLLLRAIATAATNPAERAAAQEAWQKIELTTAPEPETFGPVLGLMLVSNSATPRLEYSSLARAMLQQPDGLRVAQDPESLARWLRQVIARGRSRLRELGLTSGKRTA